MTTAPSQPLGTVPLGLGGAGHEEGEGAGGGEQGSGEAHVCERTRQGGCCCGDRSGPRETAPRRRRGLLEVGGRGLHGGEALGRELAGVLVLDLRSHSAPSAASACVDVDRLAASTYLSISSKRTSTSCSWGTLRSGFPREKTSPSFLAPVMPKSACEASPMPLTAQPSTATSIGSS